MLQSSTTRVLVMVMQMAKCFLKLIVMELTLCSKPIFEKHFIKFQRKERAFKRVRFLEKAFTLQQCCV